MMVNVAAVKPSVSDTKTYVTTVSSGSTGTNYTRYPSATG